MTRRGRAHRAARRSKVPAKGRTPRTAPSRRAKPPPYPSRGSTPGAESWSKRSRPTTRREDWHQGSPPADRPHRLEERRLPRRASGPRDGESRRTRACRPPPRTPSTTRWHRLSTGKPPQAGTPPPDRAAHPPTRTTSTRSRWPGIHSGRSIGADTGPRSRRRKNRRTPLPRFRSRSSAPLPA